MDFLYFGIVFIGGLAFAVLLGMVLDGQLKIFGRKRTRMS